METVHKLVVYYSHKVIYSPLFKAEKRIDQEGTNKLIAYALENKLRQLKGKIKYIDIVDNEKGEYFNIFVKEVL